MTHIDPDDACPECGALAFCRGPLIVCEACELLMLDEGQSPYEEWLCSLAVGRLVDVRHAFSHARGVARVVQACRRSRGPDGYLRFEGPLLRMASADSPLYGHTLAGGDWRIVSGAP